MHNETVEEPFLETGGKLLISALFDLGKFDQADMIVGGGQIMADTHQKRVHIVVLETAIFGGKICGHESDDAGGLRAEYPSRSLRAIVML
jgi:hypothetical protein